MEKKQAVVTYGGKEGIKVSYTGLWTRRDVERAHYSMVKALPQHVLKQRQKLEKEKRDAERRRKGRKQQSEGNASN